MNLDSLKYLANFNFADHFGIEVHTIKLDNSQWMTNEILDCIDHGFRFIKCTYCDDNAVIVKTGKEICYCEKDSKKPELSCEKVVTISEIINEFKLRVKNMEKYFIFLQERIHFIKLDRFKELVGKKIRDIDDSKDELILKITDFHTIIKNIQKTRNLAHLSDSEESFDDIQKTTCAIIDQIYSLIKESSKESLLKAIKKDCGINYIEHQYGEETKGEDKVEDTPIDLYEKSLDILACDFISAKKVYNFQSDVQELFDYSRWMTYCNNECRMVDLAILIFDY